ncbi:MAG: thiol reductant ABC exporter subunit CydC [Oscillospiraceae bacterium]
MRRSYFKTAAKLIVLVKPLLLPMACAIVMGVIGYLCAMFITILGAYGLLKAGGLASPFSLQFIFITLAVLAILRGVLRYAEQASNHYIAFKLLAHIRDKVFASLRRLAPAKLETRDKGNLVSVITSDIELLEVFYAHTISPVAIAFITAIIMLVFLFLLHPLFALIALLGYCTVGIVIPLFISKKGSGYGIQARQQAGGLSSTLLDSLRGLRETLQYGSGANQLHQIQEQTDELAKTNLLLKKGEGLGSAFTGAAILVFSLAILFIGIGLHQAGTPAFENIVVATVASLSSYGPVLALANLANNLVHTFAAGNRVLDILEEEPITTDVVNGTSPAFSGINCKDISFGYKEEKVLQNVSLTVPVHKIVGISGKSGSGKSTLLRLLMRFWDVDSGKIEVSDHNIAQVNTSALRKMQSFVTQDTQLFNDTIENNLKIAKQNATQQELEDACKKASVHDFIISLPEGYQSNVGELGETLSGGERQRIGLARAFLHNSPLILLDEPTSNLDSLNEGVILESLVKESSQKTVVLVSHRASTISVASEVFSLKSNRGS